ncbi:Variant surface glycoprotein [Trypanosoma congolense IL3000]|uniref:Variant surface glycoprotein n=1 Tax=Trypanosoma congolense (strain IL3000) TaxID=1068625 RepID=F9WAF1_TRYCI|nr:Variant surface glycoprotein [Trypanosoma congolense IL3000]
MTIWKGMLAMLMVIVMVMRGVRGGYVSDYEPGLNFNGAEYDALCGVFQASLDLWNASRTSEKGLDKILEASLIQALFWNIGNKYLNGITNTLPKHYTYRKLFHRGERCGRCQNKDKFYFPGSSITHDLMCLCTPGKDADPFYGSLWFFYSETGFKLCGKEAKDMVSGPDNGWHVNGKNKEMNGLEKPWRAVVMGCFNGWKSKTGEWNQDIREKVNNLNATMQNFTKLLKQIKDHHKFGGFDEDREADGSSEKHIHVRYGTCPRGRAPWWKRLNEALYGKKPDDLLVERTSNQPDAGSGELQLESTMEESLEDMAEEAEGIKSEGHTNQAGTSSQSSNGNKTVSQSTTNSNMGPLNTSETGNSTYPRLEYLRSHTPKIIPCSWLLRASFFI